MVSYFISTDDLSFAINKIEDLKKQSKLNYEISSYDLEDDSFYNVIDELTTISLFDDPKFIIVKGAEKISQISEDQFKELIRQLADTESQNALAMITTSVFNDKDRFEELKKWCSFYDIRVKSESLDSFALKSFNEDGYVISEDNIKYLVSNCYNLTFLNSYIEILKCYKADDKLITYEDIDKMVPKKLEDKAYELVNAVLEHNKELAFVIYKDLKILNVTPTQIISQLLSKFQEINNVYLLVKAGLNQDDIFNLFQLKKKGQAYYMIKNARSKSLVDIKDNLNYLLNLDYGIKKGEVDANLGLELYLLR